EVVPSARPAPMRVCPVSLHDALPIYIAGAPKGFVRRLLLLGCCAGEEGTVGQECGRWATTPSKNPQASEWCWSITNPWSRATSTDRKSTRLNSSHVKSSYAGFCLKKE